MHNLTSTVDQETLSKLPELSIPSQTRAFEGALLGLFALLLGLVTARHEMWRDELQAWLIARDSVSLVDLVHNMRYEGHPVLWQLVLFLPAHLSVNPTILQAINFIFAVTEAWLILSARKLPIAIRILLSFSFFIFYQYGAIARNYMLAILLLTAAARCLLNKRHHRYLAISLLALAINTHVFAIPVAVLLALQMFPLPWSRRQQTLSTPFQDFELLVAFVSLSAAILLAFFTVRPPGDSYTPQYRLEHRSLIYYSELSEAQALQIFLPPLHFTAPFYDRILPHPVVTTLVLLSLFLLLAATFRSSQARYGFLIGSVLEFLVIVVTVHKPSIQHYGMIFVVFLLALLIDFYSPTNSNTRRLLPHWAASVILFAFLGMQCWKSFKASEADWYFSFSDAKQTSLLLRQAGLDKYPLVIQPDFQGASLLGYLGQKTAYYPTCRCFGSYTIWKAGRDPNRGVSKDELRTLTDRYNSPVILASGWELSPETLGELSLKRLPFYSSNSLGWEPFYVYEWMGG